jgi:hypothetical protein
VIIIRIDSVFTIALCVGFVIWPEWLIGKKGRYLSRVFCLFRLQTV